MAIQKDKWDKGEIIFKSVGAVLIPMMIAIVGLTWNARLEAERSESHRIELAMTILTTPPLDDGSDYKIRQWAVSVLQAPESSEKFTDASNLLMNYITASPAICSASADTRGKLVEALLKNPDTPDAIGDPATDLILGMRAVCNDDI